MRKQKKKKISKKDTSWKRRTYYDDNFSAQEIQLIIITPFNCAKKRAAAKLYNIFSLVNTQ